MAKLHITEFSNLQNAVGVGHAQESAQLPMLPPVAQQAMNCPAKGSKQTHHS